MSEVERLLEVQDFDTVADQLRHRRAHLPERAALEAAAAALVELERETVPTRERRHELERAQKALEDEIGLVTDKAGGVHKTLYSGSTSNPRELQGLQEDLDSLRRRRGVLEDQVIERMLEAEPLDAALTAGDERRAALEAERTSLGDAIAAQEASIDAELAEVDARRAPVAAQLPPELVTLYESLRRRYAGVGIARLEGNRCLGCHLALPAAEVDTIRHLPPGEVGTCPECGRLLVR